VWHRALAGSVDHHRPGTSPLMGEAGRGCCEPHTSPSGGEVDAKRRVRGPSGKRRLIKAPSPVLLRKPTSPPRERWRLPKPRLVPQAPLSFFSPPPKPHAYSTHPPRERPAGDQWRGCRFVGRSPSPWVRESVPRDERSRGAVGSVQKPGPWSGDRFTLTTHPRRLPLRGPLTQHPGARKSGPACRHAQMVGPRVKTANKTPVYYF